MRHARWFKRLPVPAAAICVLLAAGCLGKPEMTVPEAYDYESRPILINNADWGVIPLPNNFLNPVKQAEIVYIPGVPLPNAMPTGMALPVVDETAAAVAQALGYPVVEDTALTKSLIAGMNRLNGWVTSFAPKIPFSKIPAYDSIVPFDGTNGDTANLFFLDITDPASPVVIMPGDYYRIINYNRSEAYPYYLSLRLKPGAILQPPQDFTPGHTYAVVVTGMTEETGIRAVVGKDETDADITAPVEVDNTFLVFAARDEECPTEGKCDFKVKHPVTEQEFGLAYIGSQGNPVNSVLEGLDAARQAEGARQITNYVLKIWEGLGGVKDVRDRTEVVAAFQWTTTSNPMPTFFDASAALMGGNPVVASPADYVNGDGELVPVKIKCDPAIGFGFKVAMDTATINQDTVKLFKVTGGQDVTLEKVDVTVTPTVEDGMTNVLVKATAPLSADSKYLVIGTNGMKNAAGNVAVDETYFGLTRTGLAVRNGDGVVTSYIDTPLLTEDRTTWNSPNLDSRLDTMILIHVMNTGDPDPVERPIREVDADLLEQAGSGPFGVLGVLKLLDGLRALHKPLFDAVVLQAKAVETREDIVIGWTFTTKATCE